MCLLRARVEPQGLLELVGSLILEPKVRKAVFSRDQRKLPEASGAVRAPLTTCSQQQLETLRQLRVVFEAGIAAMNAEIMKDKKLCKIVDSLFDGNYHERQFDRKSKAKPHPTSKSRSLRH